MAASPLGTAAKSWGRGKGRTMMKRAIAVVTERGSLAGNQMRVESECLAALLTLQQ